MAIIEVKVPPAGESVTEVTLIKWAKNDGERVERDQAVAEVETDKANADIFAEAAGVLKTTVKVGEVAKVGQVIATIDTEASAGAAAKPHKPEGEAKAAATTSLPPETAAGVAKASTSASKLDDLPPAARKAAVESGADLDKIEGTGRGGRVTKSDIEGTAKPVAAGLTPEPKFAAAPPASPQIGQVSPVPAPSKPAEKIQSSGGEFPTRRVAMSKIRKSIARNLVQAQQNAALLTTFNEVDMSAVMALRGKFKESFEKKHGIGLGFMSFFARAVVVALKEFERVNGRIDGDDIIYNDFVNLSIAVSTERGLTVPVLKNVQDMSMAKVESEIKRLAIAARDGKLDLSDMQGGTFTITNGGIFGSLLSTPIINAPQSAILGMHAIQQRPVAIDGKVEIRPMMYLALSYDHRLVDGRESVSFLVRVKQLLEDPTRLLLDV